MSNKIKVGIIGIGNMGSAHAHCIQKGEIEGLKLVAVCDIDNEKVNKFTLLYPELKFFSNYQGLIDSQMIDCVIIATPHPLHSEIAIYALEHGINVLLEKPADISVSKVKKLNEVAERTNKVFGIMFNQRTNLLFQRTREIVRSGQLGELKRTVWIITNWYRTQHYYDSGSWRATWSGEGGGVLLNQAPHNLDIWQWICGMPESVTGYCDIGKYHNIQVEDDATIFTRYKNGATGVFITSTGEYPGTNRLEISGTKGKLVLENNVLKQWILKRDERKVCATCDSGYTNIEYDYFEFTPENPETSHKGILQNFANAILYGEELLAPGKEGINELTISNAAYLSSWNGNYEVTIPFDMDSFDAKLSELSCKQQSNKEENKCDFSTEYKERWKVRW